MGIKALRKLQLGAETTAGTAVAADTLWRGLGGIEDQREVIFPDEDIGYLSGKARNYIPKLGAAVVMEAVPATFEALPVILSAGVKNVITGVTDTGGSGKVYTYTFPTTSANSITTLIDANLAHVALYPARNMPVTISFPFISPMVSNFSHNPARSMINDLYVNVPAVVNALPSNFKRNCLGVFAFHASFSATAVELCSNVTLSNTSGFVDCAQEKYSCPSAAYFGIHPVLT